MKIFTENFFDDDNDDDGNENDNLQKDLLEDNFLYKHILLIIVHIVLLMSKIHFHQTFFFLFKINKTNLSHCF